MIPQLYVEFNNRLSPSGRFIKRNHQDFVARVEGCAELCEFDTIDEKLWAVKNRTTVRPKCPTCSQSTTFKRRNGHYMKYCSVRCARTDPSTVGARTAAWRASNAAVNSHRTVREKYGDSIVVRRRAGVLIKYGVDTVFKLPHIQDTAHARWKQVYGSGGPDHQAMLARRSKTCMERYGSRTYQESNVYRQQAKDMYHKVSERVQQRYGVQHSSQIKIRDSLPLLKDAQQLEKLYHDNYKSVAKLSLILDVSQTTVLRYLHEHQIPVQHSCAFSQMALQWLDSVSKDTGCDIQHALNGGEYRVPGTRYKADGFCRKTNTIYEFNGDVWHGNPAVFLPESRPNPYTAATAEQLYNNTIRKREILESMGYNVVWMWEHDWVKNKDTK